jgi:radical SAM protein with 4Fe4S-binding SPASM domain
MPSSTKASFHTHSNLYHFPDALRDELRALGVTVGTSLDGRAQIHDSQRVQVNKRGGTYEKILSNLKRTTVENTILTVTKNNQGHLFDAAKHFVEDLKFTKFHFLPMMPHGREQIAALLPDINVMTEEVLKVCDYVIDHHRRGNKIAFRNLSDVLVALHGGTYTDACLKCVLNEYKIQNITISHDGRFGPCDVTADMPEYSLGNIHACQGDLREKMQSPKNFRFFKNLDSIPGCSTCAFKYSCAGGCEEESKRPGYERTIYCDFYYTLFAAVACNLEELNALGYGAEFIGDDPYVQKSPALSEHEQRCN